MQSGPLEGEEGVREREPSVVFSRHNKNTGKKERGGEMERMTIRNNSIN